jgi:Domain of unknown function (DUF4159)
MKSELKTSNKGRVAAVLCAIAIAGSIFLWSVPQSASGFGTEALFRFAVLQPKPGGSFNRADSVPAIIAELERRTSIKADPQPQIVSPTAPDIYNHPFLLMTGADEFPAFSEEALANLRRYLQYGGLLFADNSQALKNYGFDKSFRRFARKLFPDLSLGPLSEEHSIFRSFYLIDYVPGRIIVNPYFEAIEIGGRSALIYCSNDLSGAWARDSYGNYIYPVTPGGNRQREMSIRQGINLILYALTIDYKKDSVHIPYILERRK